MTRVLQGFLRRWVALLLVAFVCWPRSQHAEPTPQSAAYRAEAELVDVYASVTDQTGSAVSGLTTDDFRVFEDGLEQRVTHFSAADEPYSLGLVLDRSGSMTGVLQNVFHAAWQALQASKDADEGFIMLFNDRVDLVQDFTNDRKALRRALRKIRPSGWTALYDAVGVGLAHTGGARHRKKALLVVTDGADNSGRLDFDGLLRVAGERPVIVYLIGFFSPEMRARPETPGEVDRIALLAQATGGNAYFPESLEACKQACLAIARDLRHQYRLASVPRPAQGEGAWRAVRVELRGSADERAKHLTVRARTSYYRASAPGSKGP